MSIKSEFDSYRNSWGFVVGPPGKEGHLNQARYNSESCWAIQRHGLLDEEEIKRQHKLLDSLLYDKSDRGRGVLMRTPDNSGQIQKIDDVVAVINWARIIGHPFPKWFIESGEKYQPTEPDTSDPNETVNKRNILFFFIAKHWFPFLLNYSYDQFDPNKFHFASSYSYRLQVPAQARMAYGKKPPYLHRFWFGAALCLTAFKNKTKEDDWILGAHSVACCPVGKYKVLDKVIDFFVKKFKEKYPNGISGALVDYGWKDHPNEKHLKGEYGR